MSLIILKTMAPYLIKEELAFTMQEASPKNEHAAPKATSELLPLSEVFDGWAEPEPHTGKGHSWPAVLQGGTSEQKNS